VASTRVATTEATEADRPPQWPHFFTSVSSVVTTTEGAGEGTETGRLPTRSLTGIDAALQFMGGTEKTPEGGE
jgi:hypothetical protein